MVRILVGRVCLGVASIFALVFRFESLAMVLEIGCSGVTRKFHRRNTCPHFSNVPNWFYHVFSKKSVSSIWCCVDDIPPARPTGSDNLTEIVKKRHRTIRPSIPSASYFLPGPTALLTNLKPYRPGTRAKPKLVVPDRKPDTTDSIATGNRPRN